MVWILSQMDRRKGGSTLYLSFKNVLFVLLAHFSAPFSENWVHELDGNWDRIILTPITYSISISYIRTHPAFPISLWKDDSSL